MKDYEIFIEKWNGCNRRKIRAAGHSGRRRKNRTGWERSSIRGGTGNRRQWEILFPGFIDGHTHFDLEVAGTVTADDFETGTKAAILGGTTFVIDYASQDKGGHTLKEGLDNGIRKQMGNVPVIILSICRSWNGMKIQNRKYRT